MTLRTNDLCNVYGRVDTGRIIAGPEVRPDYDDQPTHWWHIEFAESREWHPVYQISKTWANGGNGQPIVPQTIDTSDLGRNVFHGE